MLAAVLRSSTLLIKAAQAGFESVDRRLEQAARTLGRTEWSILLWSITLPVAWRSVVAGTVRAYARALGDFGITIMVAGSIRAGPRRCPSIAAPFRSWRRLTLPGCPRRRSGDVRARADRGRARRG